MPNARHVDLSTVTHTSSCFRVDPFARQSLETRRAPRRDPPPRSSRNLARTSFAACAIGSANLELTSISAMIFVPVADFTAVCTSLSGSIPRVAPRASFGLRIASPGFVVVSAADIRRARPSAVPRRVRAKTMSLSSRRAVLVGGQTRRERRASARARVGARSPMTAQYRAVFASPGREVAPKPTDRPTARCANSPRGVATVPECAFETDVASIDGS